MSYVLPITTRDFGREVLSSDLPVVVDFYADWCGPCRVLAPILERLARDCEGRARFVKINVDEESEVASHFQVSSIPTLLILDRGRLVDRIVGAVDPRTLLERLNRHSKSSEIANGLNHS